MIRKEIFRKNIVIPALVEIQSYSTDAENLVLETAMVESGLHYVRQIGSGPALGFFQMERKTHDDIFSNFLGTTKRQHLIDGLCNLTDRVGDASELETNPFYAAAMCRIHYLRQPGAIPSTRIGRAEYYKKYYNTPLGKGTVGDYMERTV